MALGLMFRCVMARLKLIKVKGIIFIINLEKLSFFVVFWANFFIFNFLMVVFVHLFWTFEIAVEIVNFVHDLKRLMLCDDAIRLHTFVSSVAR